MSDAEIAGLGIVAGIAVLFIIFLFLVWPSNNSPADAPPEVLVEEAKQGIGAGIVAAIILGIILILLIQY